jgi:hypothetical protein
MLATRYNFVVSLTRFNGDTLEGVDIRSGNSVRIKLRSLDSAAAHRRTSVQTLAKQMNPQIMPGAHLSVERCLFDNNDQCYLADFIKPLTLSRDGDNYLVLADVMAKLWPLTSSNGVSTGFLDVLRNNFAITEVSSPLIGRAVVDLYMRHDWRLGRPFVMLRPQNVSVDVSYSLPVIGKSRSPDPGLYVVPSKKEVMKKLNAHSQSFSRLMSSLAEPSSTYYNQPFEIVPGCRFNLNSCLASEQRLINLQRAVYTDSEKDKPLYRHSTVGFKKYHHSADYFVTHIVPSLADGYGQNYSARLPKNAPIMVHSIPATTA